MEKNALKVQSSLNIFTLCSDNTKEELLNILAGS